MKWENYQDGWDNEENYKFQGDNIGVGYLTSSNTTFNPYNIETIKYKPTNIDTTYSDHSPVVSTITVRQSGGRRRRKTKRTHKRTHKKYTHKKRKSRK